MQTNKTCSRTTSLLDGNNFWFSHFSECPALVCLRKAFNFLVASPRRPERRGTLKVASMLKSPRRSIRPIYGYALGFILLLGLIGAAVSVIRNEGKAPVDQQTKTVK